MMAEMLTRITYPTGDIASSPGEPNNYTAYQEVEGTISPAPPPILNMGPNQGESFTNTYVYTITIRSGTVF